MYPELSTVGIVFAVRLAITEIPDRALFGSHAPYGDLVPARARVDRVTSPIEVRDRVLGGTIAELAGRTEAGRTSPRVRPRRIERADRQETVAAGGVHRWVRGTAPAMP